MSDLLQWLIFFSGPFTAAWAVMFYWADRSVCDYCYAERTE